MKNDSLVIGGIFENQDIVKLCDRKVPLKAISFIDNLTKEIVVSWIEPQMDMVDMKSNIDAQIAEKENPTTETLPLPSDSE